jgi:RNA polymerase sigma factor (sigma-70 family)
VNESPKTAITDLECARLGGAGSTVGSDPLPTAATLLEKLHDPEDQRSWKRFYDTYAKLLENYAVRAGLDADSARDAVQDTLIEVARRISTFEHRPGRSAFKCWLFRIIQNRVTDRFRRTKYRVVGEKVDREVPLDEKTLDEVPLQTDEMEELWDAEWRKHLLETALSRVRLEVKPQIYQMFHLHVMSNVAAAEVAKRFQTKLMRVYWAKFRVQRRIRAIMREMEKSGL